MPCPNEPTGPEPDREYTGRKDRSRQRHAESLPSLILSLFVQQSGIIGQQSASELNTCIYISRFVQGEDYSSELVEFQSALGLSYLSF